MNYLRLFLLLISTFLPNSSARAPVVPPPLVINYAFEGKYTEEQARIIFDRIHDGWIVFDHLTDERMGPARPVLMKPSKNAHVIVMMNPPGDKRTIGIPAATFSYDNEPICILIFYKYFKTLSYKDQVRTIIHEMGHFVFNLSDQYPPFEEPAAECPMGYEYKEWTNHYCPDCQWEIDYTFKQEKLRRRK
jgi:hypothetical protein